MTNCFPTICVLTQTAFQVSPYYLDLFGGFDLFFITYKRQHKDAVDFMPGSSWADGRNRLWEHVRGKYDYYLFIDDDLYFSGIVSSIEFFTAGFFNSSKLKNRLDGSLYRKLNPAGFRQLLFSKIEQYRPMVASVRTLTNNSVDFLDVYCLKRGDRLRPTGWFDAQVTLFSDTAAHLLLPYDTSFGGWWSSQIPIYCLSHLAFRESSIYILDVGAKNLNKNPAYRPGYDGFQDCQKMSAWLSSGLLDKTAGPLYREEINNINYAFGESFTRQRVELRTKPRYENVEQALLSLREFFDLLHPYVYQRHRDTIEHLRTNGKLGNVLEGKEPFAVGRSTD